MSWATCYGNMNNIHNSPALMSDARIYTDYETSCKVNHVIRQENKIKSNYDYRQYLINNGLKIIGNNFESVKQCTTKSCHNPNTFYSDKYIYKSCDDKKQPYGYETSDLKNLYLSRHELESKLKGPIITQEELLIRKSMKRERKVKNQSRD